MSTFISIYWMKWKTPRRGRLWMLLSHKINLFWWIWLICMTFLVFVDSLILKSLFLDIFYTCIRFDCLYITGSSPKHNLFCNNYHNLNIFSPISWTVFEIQVWNLSRSNCLSWAVKCGSGSSFCSVAAWSVTDARLIILLLVRITGWNWTDARLKM